MEYDPVKDKLQGIIGRSALARRLFFAAMDRLFLRSRYVAREIKRLQTSGFQPLAILDAGSGFGQYSFRLARSFPQAQVHGLDVKEDLVQTANQFARTGGYANASFAVGDLLTLPDEAKYDLILSVDVMEHIEDDLRVFCNLGRALKAQGLFIMTTPYYPGPKPGEDAPKVFIDEHVRPGYARVELEEKLARADLKLERFIITYGTYGRWAWQLLQKGPMKWLAGRIWLLPLVALYFILVYPLAWVLMQRDMKTENPEGGGILAIARKN